MLQIQLKNAGHDPGPVDGKFGRQTEQAVMDYQSKHGLPPDGVVGPKTWGALRTSQGANDAPSATAPMPAPEQPTGAPTEAAPAEQYTPTPEVQQLVDETGATATKATNNPYAKAIAEVQAAKAAASEPTTYDNRNVDDAPGQDKKGDKDSKKGDKAKLREEILRIAESQVGTLEEGNNRGGALKYTKAFGRPPEPWCAAFVSWVYTQAGQKTGQINCASFVNVLKKQGKWKGQKDPVAGDLVFFDWDFDGKPDHVGIVKAINPKGGITTIEGNTFNPNGNGQEGVFEKQREGDVIFGYGEV
jgi:hypothetical protein